MKKKALDQQNSSTKLYEFLNLLGSSYLSMIECFKLDWRVVKNVENLL